MNARKVLVGFLLLGALVIFALATFYIENWQFYVQDGYMLQARFLRALELNAGDEVKIAGVEVGRVHSLSVDPGREKPVKVSMWIRKGTDIRKNDVAGIRMRSIFGGSFLEISRVDHDAPLVSDGDELIRTRVSPGLAEIIEKSEVLLTEAEKTVKDSQTLMANLAGISERLERGEGTVGRLLTDESAYYDLRNTLQGADEALASLTRITGDVRAGRGMAGRIFADEELGARFEEAVTGAGDFGRVLSGVSEDFPQSSLGRLASDDELYMELRRTLGDLETAVASIAQSRGTVGMLINDPELYHKVSATVDGVQEIINEYREQSPILTFTGAVFGAM